MQQYHQDAKKRWGDYSSDDGSSYPLNGDLWMDDSREMGSFMEPKPLLMLLPPPHSNWVIKKVADVKRRMGYAIEGMR